jgi:hypothetical protein
MGEGLSPGLPGLITPEEAQARAQAREAADVKEAADRMRVFRELPRELTEKEWNNSGTRKLVLEHIARIESELIELKKYRSRYHEKDKESAVLCQKLTQLEAADKIFDLCMAGGGILIGLATFLLDKVNWIWALAISLIGVTFLVWPLWLKHHQKPD